MRIAQPKIIVKTLGITINENGARICVYDEKK